MLIDHWLSFLTGAVFGYSVYTYSVWQRMSRLLRCPVCLFGLLDQPARGCDAHGAHKETGRHSAIM